MLFQAAPPPVTEDSWAKRFSAYGALFVTVTVFGLFFMGLHVASQSPDLADFKSLMETVKALTLVCAGYWVGSSNSGQRKDDNAAANSAALTQALATSVPAATMQAVVDAAAASPAAPAPPLLAATPLVAAPSSGAMRPTGISR